MKELEGQFEGMWQLIDHTSVYLHSVLSDSAPFPTL